jgi:hypothetical protein
MKNKIDLHIHTNMSDGALSPKEVINEAVKNDVSVIAIADHDTIDAYTDELYSYAKSKNVTIINAVEISTKIDKAGIHVLGYNFDITNQELKKKLFLLRNARHDYLHNVAIKLNQLGYFLNIEKLDKIEAVTKAHIALDVINDSKNNKLLLDNFNHIPSKGEFIETIMNEGCPAYVKKETITPKEASDLIRKAGGKVILAHPVAYKYEDNLSVDDILMLVNEMKADGIESNYIYIDRNNKKIDESNEWNTFAKENNLITTIGSDFHNHDGIHPEIGLINENIYLSDDILNNIMQ